MLLVGQQNGLPPKNLISIIRLPSHDLGLQATLKKEPYRTITSHPFCHTLSLIVSSNDNLDAFQDRIRASGVLYYARVHMKLLEIVSGPFFEEHIKSGNILMLSEGRPSHDEIYTLRDGILRLEVDKPTFERAGLDGKVIPSQGRKHVDARYAIELNLRSPSMVRGKKGFERMLRTFTEVLNHSKTWLFCNLDDPQNHTTGPISAFAPKVYDVVPTVELVDNIRAVDFDIHRNMDQEDILELQEWFSLIMLDSPRVKDNDVIDSFLCRYSPPNLLDKDSPRATQVQRAQWRGLIHPGFVILILRALIKDAPAHTWLAMTAHAFDSTAYTIIHKNGDAIICDFKD